MPKKDFLTYMNSLPNVRVETINKIAEATCSSKMTVYRWLSGSVQVPPLKRKVIAKLLKIDEADLWPEQNNEKEKKK